MTFDPTQRYNVCLFGHSFDCMQTPPTLPGHFAADTVKAAPFPGRDTEYAVFTVDEPINREYPPAWVGVYRLPVSWLERNPPQPI